MRRLFLLTAATLAGLTAAAAAQQPAAGIKLTDVAGVWDVKTLMGPKDSVVLTLTLTATADGKAFWTMTAPGHPQPVAVRVVSTGGDSVVTEAGPYASYLRPGQMVSSLRWVAHFKGDTMQGTFAAQYASGDKIAGKLSGARRR